MVRSEHGCIKCALYTLQPATGWSLNQCSSDPNFSNPQYHKIGYKTSNFSLNCDLWAYFPLPLKESLQVCEQPLILFWD